ncbi:MAG TPA: aspartate aminotransferase family protein [Solirubrobacteraceae bacterium]|nr:aspartate aminotransferase family protein [Solirubrobacteraceae bacterium]
MTDSSPPDARPPSSRVVLDRQRIQELTVREQERWRERTAKSGEMYARASRSLAGGVASSYEVMDPWPLYLTHGEGARVWDVDGNELWDFHNAFGSMIQGHAHPVIGRAVAERYGRGTHFAVPTEDAVVVAEELSRRWNLPQWRYTNSGSEATMDAIRIARALTGRETVMKIFGSYHGHHDAVMVSIAGPLFDDIGPRENLKSIPYGGGIPAATVALTVAVPFNDAEAMEARILRLAAEGRKPACVIMEAVLMNMRVVLPEPGYLQAVREITRRHGIVLIVDEVKTGLTIASGGATERFALEPDLVSLAKPLGAGLPMGAIGGTAEVMSVVSDGTVFQVGTYNGNPLCVAAARANLLEVLTPAAYRRLDQLNERILRGCDAVIAQHRLPAYTVGLGAKGCITFSPEKIVEYEQFLTSEDHELSDLVWLYQANRGVFTTPDRDEEWTLSIVHPDEAIDAYVSNFASLAQELTS